MSPQNNGAEPDGASSAAAANSGVPKVRQAFALPGPAAAQPTELTPATGRNAAAAEGNGATSTSTSTRTRTSSSTGARGPEAAAAAPVPAPEPGPAPAPDLDPDSDTNSDPDVEAAVPSREPVPVPEPEAAAEPGAGTREAAPGRAATRPASGTAGRTGEQPTAAASGSAPPPDEATAEAEAVPGRPKKPILAAAAIAGAVLISVPLMMSGSDRDRTAAVAADSTDGTVLQESAHEQPGQYATESSSPSPSRSASSKPASSDKDKKKDAGGPGTAGKATPTPAKATTKAPTKAAEKKGTSTASSKPAGGDITVVGDALVSKDSGKCLSAGRGTDGTQLMLWTCNGSAEQHWDFRPDGTIRSKGLCMDVAWGSTENGTKIQVAWCSGNPAQQFYLNDTDDLVAKIATKCVDIYDSQNANGTPAVLWPCSGSANQTWYRR